MVRKPLLLSLLFIPFYLLVLTTCLQLIGLLLATNDMLNLIFKVLFAFAVRPFLF